MTVDRESSLDELARVFAHAAVDEFLCQLDQQVPPTGGCDVESPDFSTQANADQKEVAA